LVPFWVPSPICLGSVSPSPEVAGHKSPREPRTAPNSRCQNIATFIATLSGQASSECTSEREVTGLSEDAASRREKTRRGDGVKPEPWPLFPDPLLVDTGIRLRLEFKISVFFAGGFP